ncbi:MAG: sulfate ABC transporter ATP-binding protein [Deltaproteobacteria bacterium]|jgi:sulfate transport system ATP-binding protein|nr:sulfate ABC transporter ATP-binding protein [Deltaproteobacteria bacterium]
MFVELKKISKKFGNFEASKQVSFALPKGALAALLGPSGSGKTTILRMIAGLETPDAGEIIIDGQSVKDLPPSQRGIGFVFQNYALFRYMTVFDNIAFGLKTQKTPKSKIKERVFELLSLIGLDDLAKRYPAQLSGGQKQRVAFARALAPWPRILLLDEPFAAIDAKVRRELRAWLRRMISRLKITSVFVTHDQSEAIEVADRIIVTNEGRVEQTGSPIELYRSPATSFVARFIGESTVVSDCRALVGFENAPEGEGAVRPEFVSVYAQGEAVQFENSVQDGEIESLAFRGDALEVSVKVGAYSLGANYSLEKPPLAVGDQVKVLIYRLYAFESGRAVLISNNRLANGGAGYNFAI